MHLVGFTIETIRNAQNTVKKKWENKNKIETKYFLCQVGFNICIYIALVYSNRASFRLMQVIEFQILRTAE